MLSSNTSSILVSFICSLNFLSLYLSLISFNSALDFNFFVSPNSDNLKPLLIKMFLKCASLFVLYISFIYSLYEKSLKNVLSLNFCSSFSSIETHTLIKLSFNLVVFGAYVKDISINLSLQCSILLN